MATAALNTVAYQPGSELFLWWLSQPERPLLIGTLQLIRARQGVSLHYAATWLQNGFALSEDLPLIDMEFLPAVKESAAGAVDDARPDRWGERVIRFLDQPPRLSLLEFLFYAGDERFGALGVSVSAATYQPRWFGPLPELSDVAAIDRLVRQVLAGDAVAAEEYRLIAPGVTLGGARPKALLNLDGHPWILKFNEPGESLDMPLIEHAAMTLAAQAGIRVAQTRAIQLPLGVPGSGQSTLRHAVAVRRFDREAGKRRHALSAHVALRAAGEMMGYPELAQLLRRRGATLDRQNQAQMRELFCRMVFNILIDNTDDHEKNHVLLMNDRGEYELSPSFDVLPSGQALGYQQLRVGADMGDSTLGNALSESAQFGLSKVEAKQEIGRVARAVQGWRGHFAAAGISQADLASLTLQIDRRFLFAQRQQALL